MIAFLDCAIDDFSFFRPKKGNTKQFNLLLFVNFHFAFVEVKKFIFVNIISCSFRSSFPRRGRRRRDSKDRTSRANL